MATLWQKKKKWVGSHKFSHGDGSRYERISALKIYGYICKWEENKNWKNPFCFSEEKNFMDREKKNLWTRNCKCISERMPQDKGKLRKKVWHLILWYIYIKRWTKSSFVLFVLKLK